jgi:hypothetical protein
VTKLRRVWWVRHVARMHSISNRYRFVEHEVTRCLGCLCVRRWIILKGIFTDTFWGYWLEVSGTRKGGGATARAREYGKGSFGSIKHGEFLDELSDCGLPKKEFSRLMGNCFLSVTSQYERISPLRILDDTSCVKFQYMYLSTVSPGFWSWHFCEHFSDGYVFSQSSCMQYGRTIFNFPGYFQYPSPVRCSFCNCNGRQFASHITRKRFLLTETDELQFLNLRTNHFMYRSSTITKSILVYRIVIRSHFRLWWATFGHEGQIKEKCWRFI